MCGPSYHGIRQLIAVVVSGWVGTEWPMDPSRILENLKRGSVDPTSRPSGSCNTAIGTLIL
jgi:hypothetical protein